MIPHLDDAVALAARIAADPLLAALLAEARARDGTEARDAAHDTEHALRVALWTLRLGGDAVDAREAIAAALMHDAVDVPKNSNERALASERSADLARERLARAGWNAAAVERVARAIRDHSFSRGAIPDGPLGEALQDADRLEALGAIGLLRCVSTGIRMGGAWFDAADPWAESRELDDERFSLDHFFTKLLRLPATMRTAAGREEALRRAAVLEQFARDLGRELGREPGGLPTPARSPSEGR